MPFRVLVSLPYEVHSNDGKAERIKHASTVEEKFELVTSGRGFVILSRSTTATQDSTPVEESATHSVHCGKRVTRPGSVGPLRTLVGRRAPLDVRAEDLAIAADLVGRPLGHASISSTRFPSGSAT